MFDARKRKRCYFDYYTDVDDKSADDGRRESVDESSNEEVVKKKKKIKKTVAKITLPPIKQKKK